MMSINLQNDKEHEEIFIDLAGNRRQEYPDRS